MGEILSDIDINSKQKGNRIHSLDDKIGTPDSKNVEEMNRLDLNKT